MKKHLYSSLLALLILLQIRSAAQQSIQIILRADYRTEVKLYHDEPLLLTVGITNPIAQENQLWNQAGNRRLNQLEEMIKAGTISREKYDLEKKQLDKGKRPLPVVTLGAREEPWTGKVHWKLVSTATKKETPVTIIPLATPSTEEIAVLDEKGYYTGYFGIDPEKMKQVPAGNYLLTAAVGDETSEAIRIELLNPAMPAAVQGTEAMLLKMGQYYWHREDAGRTISYADRILAKNPVSLDGLSLKGDGLILQKEYATALDNYVKALKEYYRQHGTGSEPPEYLLSIIDWIKKESGK